MSGWLKGMAVAIVSAAAMLPLELSVRVTRATHEEAKVELPETFDVDAIDRYVAAQVKAKKFVGLSLAIVQGGKLVLSKGYGLASREDEVRVDKDTSFAIGSVTKQFTCAVALMLAEEGKLSLDDKVAKYYPGLTRAGDITLGDLAAHVSGYPDYYPLDFVDARLRRPITSDELLKKYAGGKLDFEPGTRWSYSNTGYVLLGRVLEKVTLEPMGMLFEQRLFTPLRLLHIAYQPKPGTRGLAHGYASFALAEPEAAEPEADGWLGAAAGIWATAGDLADWDLALMNGKVLDPAAMLRMTTPRRLADGRSTGYACGLSVSEMSHETVLSHGGEVNGFLASNAMVPSTRSAVIVLSNDLGSDPFDLGKKILKLVLDDPKTHAPKVAGPPAKEVARDLVVQLASGNVNRSRLGSDYGAYLTDTRLRMAAASLAPLGPPKSVEVEDTSERGGMEVTRLTVVFEKKKAGAVMFRGTDGKVEELLLDRE